MKPTLSLVAAACFVAALASSCNINLAAPDSPSDPPAVTQPADPASDEPVEPIWTPEPGHVYFLNSAGEVVEEYTPESTNDTWWFLCYVCGLTVESHNLNNPGDPWTLVKGDAPA